VTAREAAALRVEGSHLCGLAWLDGLLWYSDAGLEQIVAVDPATGVVASRLPCPGVRTGLTAAADGTRLVQVVGKDKRLRAVEPHTGEVLEEYPNPRPGGELCGLHDTADGLWTGYQRPPVLDLRRHVDHEAIVSIPVDEDVADLTSVDELVVFANHPDARLNVVDPEARWIVQVIPVAGNPTGLTWDGDRFWYCDYGAGRLRPVEVELPSSQRLVRSPLSTG
jgi:sugar lactone lactonase YvrE